MGTYLVAKQPKLTVSGRYHFLGVGGGYIFIEPSTIYKPGPKVYYKK